MTENTEIRVLSAEELRELVGWAKGEGWNPGPDDADAFRLADPEGFLGCFLEGELVAGISAVAYGTDFGFIGLYICRPDYRGQGYGLQVWNAGMARLKGRTIGLDGVPEQQANYAGMGFVTSYETARWSGRAESSGGMPTGVEPFVPAMADELASFDQRFFPAARETFLKAWIDRPRLAFVVREGGIVRGYAVIRQCEEGYKLGPLFAEDGDIAKRLFMACADVVGGAEIHIDVPAYQEVFSGYLSELGFKRGFETARMYTGHDPAIVKSGVFAITTLELG